MPRHFHGAFMKPTKIKNKDGSFSYRIYVSVTIDGKQIRENKRFSTRQLAIDWAQKRQAEIEHESIHGKKSTQTIKSVITDYMEKFSSNYGRSKNYDLARLLNYPIAEMSIDKLSVKAIIAHCIERNKEAKPQTVQNDVIWLRTVLRTMSAVNGFHFDGSVFDSAMVVLRQEKLVARSTERKRLPTFIEMLKISRYYKHKRGKIPMYDLVWFAYFSARRLSEITRLEWRDNNDERMTGMVRDAKHPREKTGNHKRFKYDKRAWRIVQQQPKMKSLIFPYNAQSIGTNFERMCKLLGIVDLHFHDLRHAATSRLFRLGYSIEQVQQFTLHDDWKTLARYTHLKPEDID